MVNRLKKVYCQSLRDVHKRGKPGVSVIIPAHNAEKFLAKVIESVQHQQRDFPLEIIVVDDGSTDGTADKAQSLGVTLIQQVKQGAAAARNHGITHSSYGYLFFLDADDLLCPDSLQRLWKALHQTPNLVAVFSRAQDFVELGIPNAQRYLAGARKEPYSGCLPGCALIRKEAFRRVGLFDATLKSGETIAWQLKLKDSGLPVASVEDVTLSRRIHGSNTGISFANQEKHDYANILRARLKARQGGG
ncbi:glycosyltransferase family 2 protein [Oscillospiraceae bacterium LTW-04]|nr:glycosyltransferase family A protein [Oscillospiraceae bacterium MB24-C1]